MKLIDTSVIKSIRHSLLTRYDRDQQIQQMIEEIGAEEGLSETELAVVHQAYLEVKERIYYTSALADLWNQIDEAQKRMSMLHTYELLEQDLFGDVIKDTASVYISDAAEEPQDYEVKQVRLHDVEPNSDDTSGVRHINLNELPVKSDLYHGKGDTVHDADDLRDGEQEDIDVMEARDVAGIDPLTAVNDMILGKKGADERKKKDKSQKQLEKLIKKRLKRIDKQWALLRGKNGKKKSKKKKSDASDSSKSDKRKKRKCKK